MSETKVEAGGRDQRAGEDGHVDKIKEGKIRKLRRLPDLSRTVKSIYVTEKKPTLSAISAMLRKPGSPTSLPQDPGQGVYQDQPVDGCEQCCCGH